MPLVTTLLLSVTALAHAAESVRHWFDIPRQRADAALYAFARQAGVQILIPSDVASAYTANAVAGYLTAEQALQRLLAGTGLRGRLEAQRLLTLEIDNNFEVDAMQNRLISTVVSMAALLAALPASAQPRSGALEEVMVTAQRRDQSLQDVPISISVMSGDAMERANFLNLEEISARMPAVKLAQGPSSDLLNIRGVGSGLNPGFEQAVATFVDGIYRGRSRAIRAALFDIERVEVLKGPQITFFGNNAIAGAFNIATRKPTREFSYNATALYEPEHGEYVLEGGLGGPLSETLAARVAVRYSGMDGYIDNDWTGEDGPDLQERIGRVSFLWQPSDTFHSELRLDGFRARNQGTFNTELRNCPPSDEFLPMAPSNVCSRYLQQSDGAVDDALDYRSGAPSSFSDLDMMEMAWTNSWDFGNHTLIATTGYYDHEADQLVELIPVPIAGVGGSANFLSNFSQEEFDQFSQEIRWQSAGGQAIDYMVGAYYAESELASRAYSAFYFLPFGGFPPATAVGYDANDPLGGYLHLDQEDQTRSVFGSATLNVREDFRINLGLRYTHVRKSAERSSWHGIMVGPTDAGFVPAVSDLQRMGIVGALGGNTDPFPMRTRKDDKWMPSVGFEWNLDDDTMLYATFTQGFKAGGFSQGSQPDVFGPESVDAYELGLKGTLLTGRLGYGIALFHSTYEDLQENTNVYEPNGSVTGRIRNVGEAVSRGVEFNATWNVTPNMQLRTDIAYLDATYTDFPNGPCTAQQAAAVQNCVQDLTDQRKAFAPRWSGNLGLRYSYPVGDLEWSIEPSVSFSSEFYQSANSDPLLVQRGYAKLDTRLAVGDIDGRWSLALIGKNLTDRTTASFRNSVGTAPGSYYALADRPRSVAIQLSLRY